MKSSRPKRRRFLKGAGLTLAALAGCATSSSPSSDPTGTPTDSPTDTATPADRPPSDTETETETETETPAPKGYSWFHERGEVLDDFTAFEDDWTVVAGEASLDDDGFLEGPAVRLDSAGSARARIKRTFPGGRDFSGVDFSLALRLESTTKPWFKAAVVLEDHAGNRRYHSRSVLPGATDTWVHLDTAFEKETGEFDVTGVSELKIEHWAGDDESVFTVDDLRLVEKPERGAVIFTFDDACPGDYEFAYPVLEQYGYKGVCYPPSEFVGPDTTPSVDQYREMYEDGWDIGGHMPRHQRAEEHTREQQRALFEENVRQLRAMGLVGDGPIHYRTPFGNYDTNTLEIVHEQFDTCAVGAGKSTGMSFGVTDPRMMGFRSGEDFEQTKELVDEAVEHRQVLGLTLHASNIDRAYMEKLAAYVNGYERNGELDVMTMTDFYERSLA